MKKLTIITLLLLISCTTPATHKIETVALEPSKEYNLWAQDAIIQDYSELLVGTTNFTVYELRNDTWNTGGTCQTTCLPDHASAHLESHELDNIATPPAPDFFDCRIENKHGGNIRDVSIDCKKNWTAQDVRFEQHITRNKVLTGMGGRYNISYVMFEGDSALGSYSFGNCSITYNQFQYESTVPLNESRYAEYACTGQSNQ